MKYLIPLALLLCSCATPSVVAPRGPGGAIASLSNTGVYFTPEGHQLFLKEGVPVDMFTLTPNGWFMTNLQFHGANKIRIQNANP